MKLPSLDHESLDQLWDLWNLTLMFPAGVEQSAFRQEFIKMTTLYFASLIANASRGLVIESLASLLGETELVFVARRLPSGVFSLLVERKNGRPMARGIGDSFDDAFADLTKRLEESVDG